MMMRGALGCAVLAVVVLSTAPRVAAQTCAEDEDQLALWAGDGECDDLRGDFNTAACGWDGGDCCASTCVNGSYVCGSSGYNCRDMNQSDYHNDTCTAALEATGDGFCDTHAYNNDLHLNKQACGWDGGDCCQSTCEGDCNHLVSCCMDPSAVDYGNCSDCQAANPAWLGDGYCDYDTSLSDAANAYNTAACGWDLGDCCLDTCEDSDVYQCPAETSANAFNGDCLDPESGYYSGNDTNSTCNLGAFSHFIADGWCDSIADGSIYNTMACGWDGGDCCNDTCVDATYTCGGTQNNWECLDPESEFTIVADGDCLVQYPSWLGDAYCDQLAGEYNTMACDWDGGDCCEDTCLAEEAAFECGIISYYCLDPNSTNFPPECPGANSSKLGNGECDQYAYDLDLHLNTPWCNWDGGDCCPTTCVPSEDSGADECDNIVFDCLDPSADDYSTSSLCAVEYPSWVGDAYCDYALDGGYNTRACNWDGGDCCEASCLQEDNPYTCGQPMYVCRDGTTDECQAANPSWEADGYCDDFPYNSAACNWDGGDCCESTCTNSAQYTCGDSEYVCLDPLLDCMVPMSMRYMLGDGVCDLTSGAYFVTEACGWDGGDCCESTCVNGSAPCGIAGYHCLDPNATNYNTCPGMQSVYYADGFCDHRRLGMDSVLNSALCDWDGGDCCPSTCTTPDGGECLNIAYTCIDANATDRHHVSDCQIAATSWLGDGSCDADAVGYNTEVCAWDGGDCCASTCSGTTCGEAPYFCVNPNATETTVVDGQCDVADSGFLGDGACDIMDTYNTAACGWDGGDCCISNCTSTEANACGVNGYACRDPMGTNCPVDNPEYLGDGYCDFTQQGPYNTAGCDWDGGDCCHNTCEDSPSFECGTIGYNCVDPDASDYGRCPGKNDVHYADGYCDMWFYNLTLHLNTAICDWDGGDCCPSTCNESASVGACAMHVYDCLDPDATDVGDKSTCIVTAPSWIGDAYCDETSDGYNTEACGWDGGDCCEASCLQEVTFYDCGHVPYVCRDESLWPDNLSEECMAKINLPTWVGDGYCDDGVAGFNTEACNWDGGDCCVSTCESGVQHQCGTAAWDCDDPTATDFNITCQAASPEYLGDGWCDHNDGGYNTAYCNWDEGDCCEVTCGENGETTHQCGTVDYLCLDPEVGADPCPGNKTQYWGDGFCDQYNYNLSLHLNNDVCQWDGGDCCPSTCSGADDADCTSVVYDCLDPTANDFNTTSDCAVANPSWLGDAYCDVATGDYNTAACGWDGGDCCEDTCLAEAAFYSCGEYGYQCSDPDSGSYTNSTSCAAANLGWLADGYCDFAEYNTDGCGWDGGDCCPDTCTGTALYDCGVAGYDCLDPDGGVQCPALYTSYIADGYCDGFEAAYNTLACGWDGGDCCEATCVDAAYTCGSQPYDCLDPNPIGCEPTFPSFLGDGYCDAVADDPTYNTEACDWDGGDCCDDTCVDSTYTCGTIGMVCRDPESTSVGVCAGRDTDDSNWGNGECDMYHYDLALHLNGEVCDWDGGDCCPSTCLMPDASACQTVIYDCLDPLASDFGAKSECQAQAPSWIDDGYCDTNTDTDGKYEYNNNGCAWDGGDCCSDTCEASQFDCSAAFMCLDPVSPNFGLEGPGVTTASPLSDGSTMTVVIVVVVVLVVIIVVVVVVVVVQKNKTRGVKTDRQAAYATHQSRPTTMIRAVEVDGGDTGGFSQ